MPAEPVCYPVAWQLKNGGYCLDEANAKNLLKNYEIMKSDQKELRFILKGLKEDK